jgi:arylsulfatase A-like enzyme
LVDAPLGFYQGFDFFSGFPELKRVAGASGQGESAQPESSERRLERRGDETVDAALYWLQGVADDPFFAWVHLYDPHLPYVPPTEYGTYFNPEYEDYLDQIRNPARRRIEARREKGEWEKVAFYSFFAGMLGLDQEYRVPRHVGPELAKSMIPAYDAEIAFADSQLARLFGLLRDTETNDDTIIIVMGDHGEILYEKEDYFGHHRFLYEGSLRIPLIMKFPGLPPGQIDVPITNVDILPTLLDAVGIENKVAMDGVSYWPLINGDESLEVPAHQIYLSNTGERLLPPPPKNPSRLQKLRMRMRIGVGKTRVALSRMRRKVEVLLSIQRKWKIEGRFQKFAVQKGDWKLIRSAILDEDKKKRAVKYELYNLASDPQENQDLTNQEEVVAEELRAILTAFLKQKRIMKVLPEDRHKTDEERQEEMRALRSLGYIQ